MNKLENLEDKILEDKKDNLSTLAEEMETLNSLISIKGIWFFKHLPRTKTLGINGFTNEFF